MYKLKYKQFFTIVWLLILTTTMQAFAQSFAVTGTVTENDEPLPGVTVMLRGTATGTVTGDNGAFQITVPNADAVLQFSFVGYQTVEVTVGYRREINVAMSVDAVAIDEVVVVGFGVQRRMNVTGAVDQVTSETFENRAVTNVSQALVGAIANLNIDLIDGKPTQSPQFNIRGRHTVGYNSDGGALVLIDGVEGDPGMLNPNDIETVTVLKDAASASIYGSRATFGVILITTKSPVKGKTSITYTTNLSSRSPTAVPDLINDSYPWASNFSTALSRWNDDGRVPTSINKTMTFSQDYLDEIKRRWENPHLPRWDICPTTGQYRYYHSTDWYGYLYKDRFFAQDHNISVSGGSDLATFSISGRYNGHDGLYRYNTDLFSQYNLRVRGSVQLTSWLRVNSNMDFSQMDYRQPYNVGEGSNIWRNINDEAFPLAPMKNEDGTLTHSASYTVGDMYLGNSFGNFQDRRIRNTIGAEARFFENSLTINADYTFQNRDYIHDIRRVAVPYSRWPGQIDYVGTQTDDFEERRRHWLYQAANIYATYVKSFNEAHNFQILAGFNYEQSARRDLLGFRNDLTLDDINDFGLVVGERFRLEGGRERWRVAGLFFRVNYNYKERYLLEINSRYDGSSRFPEGEQWALFPSASAGWRVSQEEFWTVSPRVISNLKVRGSYGMLGNGSVPAYSFAEMFTIESNDRIIGTTRGLRTQMPPVIPRSLTWEKATMANFGLDVSALNNRLHFMGDIYRRWTTEMYTVGPTLPHVFGATVPRGNFASMKTDGFEISINWADRITVANKPFRYNLRFTLADHKSVITEFYNPDKNIGTHYEGEVIGEMWGYRVEGFFRTQEEADNHPQRIRSNANRRNYVGDVKFKKLDEEATEVWRGNNRVGDSGSREIIGNSEPRFSYGINLGADWNGFFFSTFFDGVMKRDWYPSRESPFWGQYNRSYNYYPRWQEGKIFQEELQNFDAYLPRLVGNLARNDDTSLGVVNDKYMQNVAYIRLRSVNLGYNIPSAISGKIGANNMRVYVTAENIWTWSPLYKITRDIYVANVRGSGSGRSGLSSSGAGGDGDGFNYPTLKSVSLGFSITF